MHLLLIGVGGGLGSMARYLVAGAVHRFTPPFFPYGTFVVNVTGCAVFGLLAALTACYLGLNAKGGPKGVGEAVNQTVVFAFMLLFAANSVISTLFLQFKLGA